MPQTIDPVQFGQLIESVKALSADVHDLTARVNDLTHKVDELSALRNKGIGLVFGLMLSGGAVGAWITDIWGKLR